SEKAALKTLAKSGREAREQIESIDKGGQARKATTETAVADSRSILGKATPHLQAMQREIVGSYAEFKKFGDASGIGKNLAPETLVLAESRRRNRENLVAYLAGLEKYEKKRREIQQRHRAAIAEAIGEGEYQRGFLTGVDKSIDRGNQIQSETVALNRA